MSKEKRLYDLAEERRIVKKKSNPLDEALEEEEEELAREAKRLRLQEVIAKRKKELKKLEEEEEKGKPETIEAVESDISPAMARELTKLPEEERMKVIQTYAMLKSAERQQAGGILLPLLIGYSRSQPGSNMDSMVKFATAMADQIKTGVEIAKSTQPTQPPQSQWDPIKLVETFGNIITQNVQKPMEELVERVQPQPSPFERILMDDKLFERAKGLGMFGAPQPTATSSETLLEIEKLRTERETKLQELKQIHDKWVIDQQMAMKQWEVIKGITEGPVGRALERIGGGAADRIRGGPTREGLPPVETITCPSCHKTFPGVSTNPFQVCPHCGMILRRPETPPSGQPPAETEGEEEPTT